MIAMYNWRAVGQVLAEGATICGMLERTLLTGDEAGRLALLDFLIRRMNEAMSAFEGCAAELRVQESE